MYCEINNVWRCCYTMRTLCLVTNNIVFSNYCLNNSHINFENRLLECSALDIFINGRDLIHQGWELLNHPLYGNFRQGEQPFRSILLRFQPNRIKNSSIETESSSSATKNSSVQEGYDEESLHFIEQAIHWYTPFEGKLPVIQREIHELVKSVVVPNISGQEGEETIKTSNYYADCAILDRELMRKTLEMNGILIP